MGGSLSSSDSGWGWSFWSPAGLFGEEEPLLDLYQELRAEEPAPGGIIPAPSRTTTT